MHDLYVVTHPHAEHTAQDVVGGWHDSRLTARGRRDAALVATELVARLRGSQRPGRVSTSDLTRCVETAEVIGAAGGFPVRRDGRLREISVGEAEGRPNSWLAERQVPAPDSNRLDHRGPVAGAETRREVATRVRLDDHWRNRSLVSLADTSHLNRPAAQ